MKSIHRSIVLGSVTALSIVTGVVNASAPAAQGGLIWIEFHDHMSPTLTLTAESSLAAFGPSEELVISTPGDDVIRIELVNDDASVDKGQVLRLRGILTVPYFGCKAVGGWSAYECQWIPRQVQADFSTVSVPTTVVMAEGTGVPLVFRGGSASDYVQGGAADDYILGNGGDDFLYGGRENDYLDGGPGDDYIEGEAGRDDMRGGTGSNSLDAADGVEDMRVDCGGLPKLLDFDEGLDKPTNCGDNPTPIPPAPIEPVDPPAAGEGNGTVDGVPTEVQTKPTGSDNKSVTIEAPQNNIFMNTGLWLGISPNPSPFPPIQFPQTLQEWFVAFPGLFPNSNLNVDIFSPSLVGPTAATRRAAAKPVESVAIRVNSAGVAEGNVPVPAGQQPGTFTVQFNAVLASGAAAQINLGVELTQATPDPDPGPDAAITIDSAKRGTGKTASTITVRGTALGLEGTGVTPRYRIQGAKKWATGKPVTVTAAGTYTWRLVTSKKVTLTTISGAIRSKPVTVAAVRR